MYSSKHKKNNPRRTVEKFIMLGLIISIIILPLLLKSDYLLHIIILIFLFSIATLGWNILGGFTAQISLGHAVFFGIGAYTTALLQINYNISPWIGMFVGIIFTIILAIIIGFPTFQLSGHYFALATLALLQITEILFTYFKNFTGGSTGLYTFSSENNIAMFQFESNVWYYYIGFTFLLITLSITRFIYYSKFGYRLFSIKQNPDAATLSGVNLFREKMFSLIISSAIVSVAGSFYFEFIQFINPETIFSFDMTVKFALFAIIGGVNSWWGPVLGAIILIPIDEYATSHLTGNLAPLAQVVYGLLLIIMILFKPRGLTEWIVSFWENIWGGK